MNAASPNQVPVGRILFALILLGLSTPPLPAADPEPQPPQAAVFFAEYAAFDRSLAREMQRQVEAAGYKTEFIDIATLTNQARLTPARFSLLVLPGARVLPAVAAPAIESYLKGGGDLLALGLPAWDEAVYFLKGQWITRADYERTLAAQRPQKLVEDFSRADLSQWTPSTNEKEPLARYELSAESGGKALHAEMSHLGGWETIASPNLDRPFPPGHTLTCFRAKGGAKTRQLALEWTERDGSRWIATINLTPEWKDYTLTPDAFKAWPVWPKRTRDGVFNPQNAARFCVGLAMSHTALEGGRHEYWFARLGTAPNPYGDESLPADSKVPRLESISPSYQCFPITTAVLIRPDQQQLALEEAEGQVPTAGSMVMDPARFGRVDGLHPRPRGIGFNQDRSFRWEPLLRAYDQNSREYRGPLGALLVHLKPPMQGGVWGAFTPAETIFYRQPLVSSCIAQVLARMKRGVFLAEGGSEFFTVFEEQSFKAGARIVNFGSRASGNLTLQLELEPSGGGAQSILQPGPFDLGAGQSAVHEAAVGGNTNLPGVIVTRLSQDGVLVDSLRHELGVWRPKPNPEFIEARDGGFWLRDKPWKAHGVNYMPSSGIGIANGQVFEHWLGRGAYDPEVIERDLRRIHALGLNAVSVFIYRESMETQHLLDLLRRCDRLGLRVNQSLRPGTPMDFRWNAVKELIEYYRLAQNDTVFAYDLAWEPSHGDSAQQARAYGRAWNDWVRQRYGSVAAAEAAWGAAATRLKDETNAIAVPPMAQLIADGPWRTQTAAYRLFLDDVLREKYSAARRLVQSIDSRHPVSFRMSCAGDPGYNWDAALPYDFPGLAAAVDIWEPEAYGRIGDWERVKPGAFTAAYARLCDPNKPVMWAEMGYNAWDMDRMAPDPEKLEFERRYYEDFYRMLILSGADGVFFWWYPGGFRVGENSDFGIINPDGTDRPVTKVIRTDGQRYLAAPKPPKADYWIAVDRDRDARGLYGMYEACQQEYWQALKDGRQPGLKWSRRPGASR